MEIVYIYSKSALAAVLILYNRCRANAANVFVQLYTSFMVVPTRASALGLCFCGGGGNTGPARSRASGQALWQIRNHVKDYSNYFWIRICLDRVVSDHNDRFDHHE